MGNRTARTTAKRWSGALGTLARYTRPPAASRATPTARHRAAGVRDGPTAAVVGTASAPRAGADPPRAAARRADRWPVRPRPHAGRPPAGPSPGTSPPAADAPASGTD